MAKTTLVYNFENVVFGINGIQIDQFNAGDDVITITPYEQETQRMVGADGAATVSYPASEAVEITFILQAGSDHCLMLERLHNLCKIGALPGVPVAFEDVNNKRRGGCPAAHFVTRPTEGHGTSASMREFTLFCGTWKWAEATDLVV